MAPSKPPILVAEIPAIRKMIATALHQLGFSVDCCEPNHADAKLQAGRYRVLITNSPAHVRRDQIPTVYLAADHIECFYQLPAQTRIVAKPFGVDELLEALRALLMVNPAGYRKPVARELAARAGGVRAGD